MFRVLSGRRSGILRVATNRKRPDEREPQIVTGNSNPVAAPGWYDDPWDDAGASVRWWDGGSWTGFARARAGLVALDVDGRPSEASGNKPERPLVEISDPTRASLVWETRFVLSL